MIFKSNVMKWYGYIYKKYLPIKNLPFAREEQLKESLN